METAMGASSGRLTPNDLSDDRIFINIDHPAYNFVNSNDQMAGVLLHEYSHIAGQTHGGSGWTWVPGAGMLGITIKEKIYNAKQILNFNLPW